MSLTKKVYLTISGYDIKLSDNLTFYQKDQLKLIFYINEYGIDYENNATARALMPVNPLNAILFIENPDGVDSVSSARIEDNAVTFYLDSTHTQYVGVSRMQLRLFDQDGCAITLPHFTFEIRENIYGSGDVRFQNVVMVDQTGTVILTEDNDLLDVGDILTMGTEVAYPQVTKTIKELPIKHDLDGTEKLIVEDNEATKQAPLGTIVDEIKQNSQEKIREIESELNQINNDLTIFNHKTQSFVTPEQFGAVGDGIADDTEAIQRASDNCKSGQKLLFGANKKYKITDTIIFYRTNVIDGNGCFIMIDSNFKEGSRFAFEYHKTSNSNNILDTFIMGNEIKNFNIQHYGNLEGEFYNGIYVAENCHVKNIYCWGLNKVVEVTKEAYIDFITIEDINIWGKWGNDFAIDTGHMGDARVVKNIHFTPVDASNYNVLKVGSGHNTCRIEGIVNGHIVMGKSLVDVSNLHLEYGTITFNGTRGSVKEVFMWCPQDGTNPIVINDESAITLENCYFHYFDRLQYDFINAKFNELKLGWNVVLKIRNCFKNILPPTDVTFLNPAGITIEGNEDFNNNSLCNSIESTILNGRCVPSIMPTDRSNPTYNILGAFHTDGNVKWKENSATYYYNAILVYDEKRKIGQTRKSGEVNKAITNAGRCPYIVLNGRMNSNIKVYRGTSSKSYDKVAIVGPRGDYLHDNGYLVNGVKWQNRKTSNIDNNYLEAQKYILHNDGTVTISAVTTPTAGEWKKGDRIENSTYAPGFPKSWVFNGSEWVSEGNL